MKDSGGTGFPSRVSRRRGGSSLCCSRISLSTGHGRSAENLPGVPGTYRNRRPQSDARNASTSAGERIPGRSRDTRAGSVLTVAIAGVSFVRQIRVRLIGVGSVVVAAIAVFSVIVILFGGAPVPNVVQRIRADEQAGLL